MSQATTEFKLPASLVSRTDAARLIRELDILDNNIRAQTIRRQQVDTSYVSPMLMDAAQANGLDLTNDDHRQQLATSLRRLKTKSPIVHIAFAERPQSEFMQQMAAWVRSQLHPGSLIHIGLQPDIVAGCIVRTPSHIYDFSIRHILKAKKPMLLKRIQV